MKPKHGEVRHGYTLADIHRIATTAVRSNFTLVADRTDLYEAAWGAIVEALLIVSHWPTKHDLATAARAGIWALARAERHHHGAPSDDYSAAFRSAPRFVKYWTPGSAGDFTEAICERIATQQVNASVRQRDREILQAVAAAGSYEAAAGLLGLSYRTTASMANFARRRWLEVWHDGETPHKYTHFAMRRTRRDR